MIANPPFSLKDWGADHWTDDPYGRNLAGVPPKGNGDLAWVQHMIKSMKAKTGRMAVVLPLLFFKRVCDVYNEEFATALKESNDDSEYAAFEENHRFQIPKGAHWEDVRETTVNVGVSGNNF